MPEGQQNRHHTLVYVAESDIEGEGIFAKRQIRIGEMMGETHRRDPFMAGRWKVQYPLGNYNHSNEPNISVVKRQTVYYMQANRPISQDEEILGDYRNQPELEQPQQGWT